MSSRGLENKLNHANMFKALETIPLAKLSHMTMHSIGGAGHHTPRTGRMPPTHPANRLEMCVYIHVYMIPTEGSEA